MDDRGSFSATQIAFLLAQDEAVRRDVCLSGASISAHAAVPKHDRFSIPTISEQKGSFEDSVSEPASTMDAERSCFSAASLNAVYPDVQEVLSNRPESILDLDVEQIVLLSREQVHALSTTQLASMSAEQACALTTEQLENCAWDDAQIDAWVAALDA